MLLPASFASQVAALAAGECRVLLVLAARASVHELVWPSIARLAADAGLSRRAVFRALSALERRGLVSNTGKVTRHGVKVRRLALDDPQGCHGCHPPRATGVTPLMGDAGVTQNILNKTGKEDQSPIPLCAAKAAVPAEAGQHADTVALITESLVNDDLASGEEAEELARQAVAERPAGDLQAYYRRALKLAAERWACLGGEDREVYDRVRADVSNLRGADKAGDVDEFVFEIVLAAVRDEWRDADGSGRSRLDWVFWRCVERVAVANGLSLADYIEAANLLAA